MAQGSSRRDFLKQSSALGAAAWVSGASPGWTQETSANEQINFACIGVGGKGSSDTADAARHGNIVAICDVDDITLAKAALKYPKAKKFNDYRKMLEEIGNEIDAVTVSTPDHSHAPASIRAMKAGKHCFTQKPLTWSIHEARVMRETAAKMGLATQMGNQGTSHGGLREAVEVIRSGAIGTPKEVHVWTNRPIWPQGIARPEAGQTAPETLHWDLFLGPAQERPYADVYHPFKWRGWVDFGTGALGDMACHTLNMAFMALNLVDPISVEAESDGIYMGETYPKDSQIRYEFGQNGDRPPVSMIWYDGGKLPPAEMLMGEAMSRSGSLILGDKGTLYSPNDYGSSYVLLPKEQYAEYEKPEPTLPRSDGHFTEFAQAIKGGPPAMSNFDYAGQLTETVLLGNVALRAGKKIEWDAANLTCPNAPEADQYIRRDYREGWEV